jgi:hypothetical protein
LDIIANPTLLSELAASGLRHAAVSGDGKSATAARQNLTGGQEEEWWFDGKQSAAGRSQEKYSS